MVTVEDEDRTVCPGSDQRTDDDRVNGLEAQRHDTVFLHALNTR